MFCSKCGKPNADNARFCASCGAAMPEVQPMAAQPVMVQPMAAPQTMTQAASAQPVMAQPMAAAQAVPQPAVPKKKKGFKVLIAVLVLLLLVAVGVVAFVMFSRAAHEKKVNSQLALAEQYLDELEYEEAVAAYLAVLELDEKNEEAADGLTDAYIKWAGSYAESNDYDKALEILQNADERASSRDLKKETELIETQKADYAEQQRLEQERLAEEQRQREAEEAKQKAGETLQSYMDSVLIPMYGMLDCSRLYEAAYIADSSEGYWAICSGCVPDSAQILSYDIRDYDMDGQAEMLVLLGKKVDYVYGLDWREYTSLWLQMYEADGYECYLAVDTDTEVTISGESDGRDVNVYLAETEMGVHICIDSAEIYGMYADGVTYAVEQFCYVGSEFLQEISFMAGGSAFETDEFAGLAKEMEDFGFHASAVQTLGEDPEGYWGTPAYDAEGDHMERMLQVCAKNPYLFDYESYYDSGDYSLWWDDHDPAGLGKVVYGFSRQDGGMAAHVDETIRYQESDTEE